MLRISLKTVLSLLLLALMPRACDSAAKNVDWPQYSTNPFVVKLDFSFNDDESGGSMITADVDNDGLMDYVVTAPGHVAAYAHNGKRLWHLAVDIQVGSSSETYGLPGHHAPGVQAGDIDGDGKTEVVGLTKDGYLNIVDGATGEVKLRQKMESPEGSERWEHVIIANFRGKGDRDLLLQATNKSGYRMGRYMAAYAADKLDDKPLWRNNDYLGCAHNGARVADIDGDGRDEVLGATMLDDDGHVTNSIEVDGHLDSVFVYDVLPQRPGLEVVMLEEGGQRVFLCGQDKLIWATDYKRQEPQNAAVGKFNPEQDSLYVWCRSRYDEHQKPFVFDSEGKLTCTYEMDNVAPNGWTVKGVETIWAIDWTGESKQLAVAKERHCSGDVCIFDPISGEFIKRIPENAHRLYVADVSGDWREEILVIADNELHIYSNPDKNPNPKHPHLWEQNAYRRSKMTWNYYSP